MRVYTPFNWGSKRIEGKKWYTVAFDSVVIPAMHTTVGDDLGDGVIDDLGWDSPETRETSAMYLAGSPEEALKRAEEAYPDSKIGYTVIKEEDAFEATEEDLEELEREIADYYG